MNKNTYFFPVYSVKGNNVAILRPENINSMGAVE